MGGLFGGTTQTTTANSKPWDKSIPYLKESMYQAAGLLNKGIGSQPYGGPTYVPWSNQTNKGMGMYQDAINQGSSLMDPTMSAFQRMIQNNGMTQGMRNNMDLLNPLAQGQQQINPWMYQNAYQQANQGMAGQGQLQQMLAGQGVAPQGQSQLYDMMHGSGDVNTSRMSDLYHQLGQGVSGEGLLRGMMGGAGAADTSNYQQLYNTADQNFAGERALAANAKGDFLQHGNPYLMRSLQQGARDIASQVNLSAAGAGSFGSGTAQKALAQQLGGYYNSALSNQYDQDRASQLQAQGLMANIAQQQGAQRMGAAQGLSQTQLANTGLQSGAAGMLNQLQQGLYGQQAGIAGQIAGTQAQNQSQRAQAANLLQSLQGQINQSRLGAGAQLGQLQGLQQQGMLGAAQGFTGVQGSNISNQANAVNQLLNMQNMAAQRGMSAASMAPQIDQWRFQPAQQQMQLGNAYDQFHQTVLNDTINRWNAQQAAPWENLARYNAIVSGAGQLGGERTTTAPGPSPFLSMFGGGMMGTGMASSLVNSGIMSASNPFAMMMPFMGAGMGFAGAHY